MAKLSDTKTNKGQRGLWGSLQYALSRKFRDERGAWPFDDPPSNAVITDSAVIDGHSPIFCVYHDADDKGWQFLSGTGSAPRTVSL